MIETTMGKLIDIFIKQFVILAYQNDLDDPEVIGSFNDRKEAQLWIEERYLKDVKKYVITFLVPK